MAEKICCTINSNQYKISLYVYTHDIVYTVNQWQMYYTWVIPCCIVNFFNFYCTTQKLIINNIIFKKMPVLCSDSVFSPRLEETPNDVHLQISHMTVTCHTNRNIQLKSTNHKNTTCIIIITTIIIIIQRSRNILQACLTMLYTIITRYKMWQKMFRLLFFPADA